MPDSLHFQMVLIKGVFTPLTRYFPILIDTTIGMATILRTLRAESRTVEAIDYRDRLW